MANLFNYISWAAILIPFVTTKGGSVWMMKVEKDAFYSSNKVRMIDYSSSSSYFDKVMGCLSSRSWRSCYTSVCSSGRKFDGTISVLILARSQNPMILRSALKRSRPARGVWRTSSSYRSGSIFGQFFLNHLTTLSIIFPESIKFVCSY